MRTVDVPAASFDDLTFLTERGLGALFALPADVTRAKPGAPSRLYDQSVVALFEEERRARDL